MRVCAMFVCTLPVFLGYEFELFRAVTISGYDDVLYVTGGYERCG